MNILAFMRIQFESISNALLESNARILYKIHFYGLFHMLVLFRLLSNDEGVNHINEWKYRLQLTDV